MFFFLAPLYLLALPVRGRSGPLFSRERGPDLLVPHPSPRVFGAAPIVSLFRRAGVAQAVAWCPRLLKAAEVLSPAHRHRASQSWQQFVENGHSNQNCC